MLPDDDLVRNYAGVFDRALGFGRKPGLIIVDLIRAYTQEGSPLYAPTARAAADRTAVLRHSFAAAGLPVVFTRVIYGPEGRDGGLFVRKVSALKELREGAPLAAFVEGLEPGPQDVVITKQYASAFFGTALASLLTSEGVDTAVIAGVSTSGCVRATAVDAMQHGFRPVVVRDCVADRHKAPHEANLFDIAAKYGDVLGFDDVMTWFTQTSSPQLHATVGL